jgi:hypothetical protein
MSDAVQPWSDSERPASEAQPPPAAAAQAAPQAALPEDALAGDWSEGLLGAAREHGLPLPERVALQAAARAEEAPVRRSAEELVAEAAGKLSAEALRTEQASAASLIQGEPQRGAPPTIEVAHEPSVIVPEAPVATETMHVAEAPAATETMHVAEAPVATETMQVAEAAPPARAVAETVPLPAPEAASAQPELPADQVAEAIHSALALEAPAGGGAEVIALPGEPQGGHDAWAAALSHAAGAPAETPETVPLPAAGPADLWAQTTAAASGPDVWSGAPPVAHSWEAGPAAAAAPDWSATPADGAAAASWHPAPAQPPPPPVAAIADVPDDLDADLPLPLPEAEIEPEAAAAASRPAFLEGEPRVVVHTLAGRVKRGTLRDADLEAPELLLTLPAGGAEERIALADVKAVFFMLAPGEQPPPPPGGRVRVTLSDGRQLDGFREASGPGGGLFLVPLDAARTNTRAIFVCGDAIQAVDMA